MYMTEESASRYLFELKLDEWAEAAHEIVEDAYEAARERLGFNEEGKRLAGHLNAEYFRLQDYCSDMRALSEAEIQAVQLRQLMGAQNTYPFHCAGQQNAVGSPWYGVGAAGLYALGLRSG